MTGFHEGGRADTKDKVATNGAVPDTVTPNSTAAPWFNTKVQEPHLSSLQKCRKQLRCALHSIPVQLFMFIVVIADLAFIVHRSAVKDGGRHESLAGLVILFILSLEVVLRLVSDGGLFVRSPLSMLELIFVFFGIMTLIFENRLPIGLGRMVRPLLKVQRACRLVLLVLKKHVELSRAVNTRVTDTIISKLLRVFGKLVEVHPSNLQVVPRHGLLRITKANLASEAISDLHLPFAIRGGFLEGLSLHFRTLRSGDAQCKKKKQQDNVTTVEIDLQNLLLVIGPSDPIDWDDKETLRMRKSKLVDLMVDTLASTGLLKRKIKHMRREHEDPHDVEPSRTTQSSHTLKAIKKTLLQTIWVRLLSGVEVVCHNVSVRYEDVTQLLRYPVAAGFHVGSISIFARETVLNEGPQEAVHDSQTIFSSKTRSKTFTDLEKGVPGPSDEVMENDIFLEVVRCGMFLDVKPTTLYSAMMSEGTYEAALRTFKMANSLERVRLVALNSVMEKRELDSMKCMLECASETGVYSEVYQQNTYMVIPFQATVTIPVETLRAQLLAPNGTGVPAEATRLANISISPLRVVLDNQQASAFNLLLDFLKCWQCHNSELLAQPEDRISAVKDGAQRSEVIRQWWLHAFRKILEVLQFRTRHVFGLAWMKRRARDRLEYLELLTGKIRRHEKMAKRQVLKEEAKSAVMDGKTGLPLPEQSQREVKIYESTRQKMLSDTEERRVHRRLHELHLQMTAVETCQCYVKASMLAQIREYHGRYRHIDTMETKTQDSDSSSSGSSSSSSSDDDDEDDIRKSKPWKAQASTVAKSVEYRSSRPVERPAPPKRGAKRFLPKLFHLQCPLIEGAFLLVEGWNTLERDHPNHKLALHNVRRGFRNRLGRRHPLARCWVKTLRLTSKPSISSIEEGFSCMGHWFAAECVDAGAVYCEHAAGVETTALKCRQLQDESARSVALFEVGTWQKLVTQQHRHPHYHYSQKSGLRHNARTQKTGSLLQKEEVQWTSSGVFRLGDLNVHIDTAKLIRIVRHLRDTSETLQAEAHTWWRVKQAGQSVLLPASARLLAPPSASQKARKRACKFARQFDKITGRHESKWTWRMEVRVANIELDTTQMRDSNSKPIRPGMTHLVHKASMHKQRFLLHRRSNPAYFAWEPVPWEEEDCYSGSPVVKNCPPQAETSANWSGRESIFAEDQYANGLSWFADVPSWTSLYDSSREIVSRMPQISSETVRAADDKVAAVRKRVESISL